MHADIFGRLNGVCLHGVVDRRQEGPNWLTRLGFAEATLYPNAEAAFADRVEAVVIATSPDSHVALIAVARCRRQKSFLRKTDGVCGTGGCGLAMSAAARRPRASWL